MSPQAMQEQRIGSAMSGILKINYEFYINKITREGDSLNAEEYYHELNKILYSMYDVD